MSYYFLEPPIPLTTTAEPIPFPLEELPRTLREFVRQTAKTLQVHSDMPSALTLSVLAACVQGKTKISITPEWQEELSLYTAVIAEPGERKSAVFSALTAPIYSYAENYNLTHAAEISAYQNNVKRLEIQKNKLIGDNADEEQINEIQAELSALLANPVVPLRLIAADCTPEALAVIMSRNNDKISILSDEGVFDVMSGLYTSGRSNINIYLNAYDGQSISIDRKGSGSLLLRRPLITFGICCQPSVITEFIGDRQFVGKGLAQRFLFSKPPSLLGRRTLCYAPVESQVRNSYSALINRLLEMRETSGNITMSAESFKLFNSFYDEIESKLGQQGKFSVNRTFLSKLAGKTARICGLLHLCEHSVNEPVSPEMVNAAVKIARYFMEQNEIIFSTDSDLAIAEYAADRIVTNAKKNGCGSFRARDIKRFCQKYKAKQLDEALTILCEHNYIQFTPDDRKNPSKQCGVYSINPYLLRDRQGSVKQMSS
ncbi:MAG: YfjI family protein [Eubacterium sp.]|nr:YfjI family protein [Eubacterium sp.]